MTNPCPHCGNTKTVTTTIHELTYRKITIPSISTALGLSQEYVRVVLKRLEKRGMVKQLGPDPNANPKTTVPNLWVAT